MATGKTQTHSVNSERMDFSRTALSNQPFAKNSCRQRAKTAQKSQPTSKLVLIRELLLQKRGGGRRPIVERIQEFCRARTRQNRGRRGGCHRQQHVRDARGRAFKNSRIDSHVLPHGLRGEGLDRYLGSWSILEEASRDGGEQRQHDQGNYPNLPRPHRRPLHSSHVDLSHLEIG